MKSYYVYVLLVLAPHCLMGGAEVVRTIETISSNNSNGDDQQNRINLLFGVLLPLSSPDPDKLALHGVQPAMELAIHHVQHVAQILPADHFNITMKFGETNCSSVTGPLAAFNIVIQRYPGLYFDNSSNLFWHHIEHITPNPQMPFSDRYVIMFWDR